MLPNPVSPTRPICAGEVPRGEDLRRSFSPLHFNPWSRLSCLPQSVWHTLTYCFSNSHIFLSGNTACDGAGVVSLHLKGETEDESSLLALLQARDWAPSSSTLATDGQGKFFLNFVHFLLRFLCFWNNFSPSSSSSTGPTTTIRSTIASIISKVVVAPESKPSVVFLVMLHGGICDLLVFGQNLTKLSTSN